MEKKYFVTKALKRRSSPINMHYFTHLECARCGKIAESEKLHNLCECGGPFLCRYDLARLREEWGREALQNAPKSLWRYSPVLPVREDENRLQLGEGWTPLLDVPRLRKHLGLQNLFVKEESPNVTASFKARGLCIAVSRAKGERAGREKNRDSFCRKRRQRHRSVCSGGGYRVPCLYAA
jgi:threonine synthase